LPLALASAGLLWGLARGLGNVVEGPVSTTVRSTTHAWLTRGSALHAGLLARYPLAKRLSESELVGVVRAAPAEILDAHQGCVEGEAAGGGAWPRQVIDFVRDELHRLVGSHGAWVLPELERLRARAKGASGERPTLQETIEAMVAPSVFHDAATTIRARAG